MSCREKTAYYTCAPSAEAISQLPIDTLQRQSYHRLTLRVLEDGTVPTFGENLRRERELRGITLLELANATKISPRHLQALEKDRFDRLPGGVFNRGFVRAVARYMNMDEHHWVGEYVRAVREEPEILARYAPPQAESPASARRGLWSFALLVVVFGVSAYLIHDMRLRRAAEAAPALAAAPKETAQAPPQATAPPTTTAATAAPAAMPTLTSASSPVRVPASPAVSDLRLQVDALEEAWVSVALDGQPAYSGTMKPGDSRNFRAGGRIELTTGNASAVVLTLNGETLAPLGNPGERKNVVLTAKDLKPQHP